MKTDPESGGRDGFLFLGNQLALDFLNTRPVQSGQALELLPDFAAVLRWFRAAGVLSSGESAALEKRAAGSGRARETVRKLRDFREMLRKEVIAWEEGREIRRPMLDELNQLMAAHPARTRLKAKSAGLLTEQWFVLEQPDDLLGPLAHSAAALFAQTDRTRVRKCDQCVLHFHDTSKKGARRWCSMELCGNRSKVAAYAARRRAS